jgi:transposase-like protein
MYTINVIENVNASSRKVTKNCSFPNKKAVF